MMRIVFIVASIATPCLSARVKRSSATGTRGTSTGTDEGGDWIFAFRTLNSYAKIIDNSQVTITAQNMKKQQCRANDRGLVCLKVPANVGTLNYRVSAPTCGSSSRTYQKSHCSDMCLKQEVLSGFGGNCAGTSAPRRTDRDDLNFCRSALQGNSRYSCNDASESSSGQGPAPEYFDTPPPTGTNGGSVVGGGSYHCSTGSGASCKTCEIKAARKFNNHCTSCNDGYFLYQGSCKGSGSNNGDQSNDESTSSTTQESCAMEVEVTGEEERQGALMGRYEKTNMSPGEKNDGHPIYKNKKRDQYLFFWKDYGNWMLGGDSNDVDAGLMSQFFDEPRCPGEASKWTVFVAEKKGWSTSKSLSVVDITTTPTTTKENGGGDDTSETTMEPEGGGAVSIHNTANILLLLLVSSILVQ